MYRFKTTTVHVLSFQTRPPISESFGIIIVDHLCCYDRRICATYMLNIYVKRLEIKLKLKI